MMRSATTVLLFFAPFSAMANVASLSTTTTTAVSPRYTINIGQNGRTFSPAISNALVGDIVEFVFYPQNHSVVRADYGLPCQPYEWTGFGRSGFWSGFQPVSAGTAVADYPRFQIRINDTLPIFFYCSAPDACIVEAMVGVINSNDQQTFQNQAAFAKNTSVMYQPGDFPPEVARTTTSTSSTATPTSSTTSPTTTAADHTDHTHLSAGAIAGISIAGVVLVIVCAVLIYLCGRQKSIKETLRRNKFPAPPTTYITNTPISPGQYRQQTPNMEIMDNANAGFSHFQGQQGHAPPYDRGTMENGNYHSGHGSPPRTGSPQTDPIRVYPASLSVYTGDHKGEAVLQQHNGVTRPEPVQYHELATVEPVRPARPWGDSNSRTELGA